MQRMICQAVPSAIREAAHAPKASPSGHLRHSSAGHRSKSARHFAALLPLAVARRALVISTTAAVPSALGGLFGGGGGHSARSLVQSGADKFLRGDVAGSLTDFDAAYEADASLRPYLWQRGISAYYAEAFEAGAAQFHGDVAVNPNDTEEAIWAFLCEARLHGADDARRQFLQVGRDSRPIMRAAYECFRAGADPKRILAAAEGDLDGHDRFYALLYAGLWHEAEAQPEEAERAMVTAVRTAYGQRSGDYMAAVARVHCQQRGWST